MKKGMSISTLELLLQKLDIERDSDGARNTTFRDKDVAILKKECQEKLQRLTELKNEKTQLDDKIMSLKEILCDINPEALEQIQRDVDHKNNNVSDSNQEAQGSKEKSKSDLTKSIKKRNDKKKKRRERLFYD